MPAELNKGFLASGLRYKGMLRYPKSKLEKDPKYEMVKDYIKSIYNWSEIDCKANKMIIEMALNDKEFTETLCHHCGFDNSERKKFGMDIIKKNDITVKKSRGIFDYL